MKTIIKSLAALLVVTSCATKAPEWTLSWTENFDSTQLDTSVWSKIPRGSSDWDRHMSNFDSLYALRDGNLILKGILNTTQKDDTASFITGGVFSKDKKLFGHGKIEIRAKLGMAQGYWPAFWMLPATEAWPSGGEIDIMEHLNSDTIAYQTLHTPYTLSPGYINNPPKGSTGAINNQDYNIYGIERYQDSICMFINGIKTLTYHRIDSLSDRHQFPFNEEPFYLLLDSQLGGNWVGKVNPDDLPVEMAIDWVKFWELESTSTPKK
ncbi:MAG: glycoside hydrolase family 16 protein [Rikenellaceae bacterium]